MNGKANIKLPAVSSPLHLRAISLLIWAHLLKHVSGIIKTLLEIIIFIFCFTFTFVSCSSCSWWWRTTSGGWRRYRKEAEGTPWSRPDSDFSFTQGKCLGHNNTPVFILKISKCPSQKPWTFVSYPFDPFERLNMCPPKCPTLQASTASQSLSANLSASSWFSQSCQPEQVQFTCCLSWFFLKYMSGRFKILSYFWQVACKISTSGLMMWLFITGVPGVAFLVTLIALATPLAPRAAEAPAPPLLSPSSLERSVHLPALIYRDIHKGVHLSPPWAI